MSYRFVGLIAALSLAGPLVGGTIFANNICLIGPCQPQGVLAEGQSISTPFSLQYTFPGYNTVYQLTGTFAATNRNGNAAVTAANVTMTFLGGDNTNETVPDRLVLNFEQTFQTFIESPSFNNSGNESVSGSFVGPLADATTVDEQAYSNGGLNPYYMALMGDFTPPGTFYESHSHQPFAVGPVMTLGFVDTIQFGPGSGPGSTIVVDNVPTPEPATLFLLILAGVLDFVVRYGRRAMSRSPL